MFLLKSAGVLTVLTLAVGIVTAQDSTPRYRTFISDTTLPGVDTGMRDKDAPRPPRPYPADAVTRSGGEAYLRGSIAVKFRPGTAPGAERQMMNRVGATTMEAPSYADFQIVTIDENADPEAGPATRRRIRTGALHDASDVCAERSAVLTAVELSANRHGASMGSESWRHLVDCRGRPRQWRGVSQRGNAARHSFLA